jgi:fatty-acyl-CoA synthase
VLEVQVFGVPDDKLGEEVCAWIIPVVGSDVNQDALTEFCQGQIAHFKIPRYFRIVDELPMTITGKPQKFIMRDKMIEALSLEISLT